MGSHGERCPHCGAQIENFYSKWCDRDYANHFFLSCESCGKAFEVEVYSVPEFEISVPKCRKCHEEEVGGDTYCARCLRELQSAKAVKNG